MAHPHDSNYPDSGNPPPPYTLTPAAPGSSSSYPSHSDVSRYAHSQPPDTYNNSQAMNPSSYGYDTRLYPENMNHGHYASAPRPPETGLRQAHVSDTGPYGAYGHPYASNRGPYQAYGDPHTADTGSYEAPRDAHAPNAGSYKTYHVPHASDTGQYSGYRGHHVSETRPYVQRQSFPSSSPPTNSAYPLPSDVGPHSGASQPPDARADASNAMPLSNFVSEHLVFPCRAPTDLSPTLCRRWFVILVVGVIDSQGFVSEPNCPCLSHYRHLGHGGHYRGRSSLLQGDRCPVARCT
jgi:hypothetical protein